VLATFLFVAFWVVIAVSLLVIAIRLGRVRRTPEKPSPAARRAAGLVFALIYVGFGVAIPLVFLAGNHSNASAQVGGITLTAAEKHGRELFGQNCSVCHTLAAANAVGKVGPNLDKLKPPALLVLNTINNGCVQNPPANSPQACLGFGTMPAQLLEGKNAQDVANFVARVTQQP
jgi:mono/diheme cytochrome c family protein